MILWHEKGEDALKGLMVMVSIRWSKGTDAAPSDVGFGNKMWGPDIA